MTPPTIPGLRPQTGWTAPVNQNGQADASPTALVGDVVQRWPRWAIDSVRSAALELQSAADVAIVHREPIITSRSARFVSAVAETPRKLQRAVGVALAVGIVGGAILMSGGGAQVGVEAGRAPERPPATRVVNVQPAATAAPTLEVVVPSPVATAAPVAPPPVETAAPVATPAPVVAPAPAFTTPYAALVAPENLRTGPGEVNIVSLRQPTDADSNGGLGLFDDLTVVFWRDAAGTTHVREFTSNTDPAAHFRYQIGADTDGNGSIELGRVPAGFYTYRTIANTPNFGDVLMPNVAINTERDANQDGLFNDNAFYNDEQQQMLFHRAPTASFTGSAGCQTLPPGVFEAFWDTVAGAPNKGSLPYTLVDVTQSDAAAQLLAGYTART